MRKCVMSYVNNKGADQPAIPRSLISAFAVRCLYSIIPLDSMAEISKLYLASVAAQAGLCLGWSETPEDTFSHGVAHLYSNCYTDFLVLHGASTTACVLGYNSWELLVHYT